MKTFAVGSCVCITLGGRWFLATAGHLLKGGNPVEVVPGEGHRPVDLTKARRSCCKSDPVDLGLVELTSDQAREIGEDHFLDVRGVQASFDTSQAHTVVICGFPSANEFTRRGRRASFAEVSIRTTIPSNDFTCNIEFAPDHTRDVFVEIPETVNRHYVGPGKPPDSFCPRDSHPPDPGGLSGGGIWLAAMAQRKGSGILYPHPRLVAIQVGHFQKRGVLRGVSISHWLNLLGEECPDLRTEITSIINAG